MECLNNLKVYTDDFINYELIERKYEELVKEVKERNKCNLTDIDSMCEAYIVEILNIVYGWNLKINEYAFEKAIDAIDKENKIVLQITSSNRKDKIINTFDNCKENKDIDGYRLVYFIIGYKMNYRLKNELSSQSIKVDIIDTSIILEKIKENSDSILLSKVYDNIIRIYDGVGITGREIREIVNRGTANKNKYGDKYNVVVVDEMFNISLQFVGAANIFDDNYAVLRYNDMLFYISEENLHKKLLFDLNEFCEYCVHEVGETDYSYIDFGHTSIYIDKHKVYRIYKLLHSIKDCYFQVVKEQKEHAGIEDDMKIDKQHKKVIIGRITKRQWKQINEYAANHIYREKIDDDYIFYNSSSRTLWLGGYQEIKYKGVYLVSLSIIGNAWEYAKDDDEIELYWKPGEESYNMQFMKFDNVNYWKANYTREYVENKILKSEMKRDYE